MQDAIPRNSDFELSLGRINEMECNCNSLSSTITQAQALNGPSDLDNAPFYFTLTLPPHRLNIFIGFRHHVVLH